MEINGGSVVAMLGKDCVAIATDLRLGNQSIGVAHNFDKVGDWTKVPHCTPFLPSILFRSSPLTISFIMDYPV